MNLEIDCKYALSFLLNAQYFILTSHTTNTTKIHKMYTNVYKMCI